jgi:hypothetical protein
VKKEVHGSEVQWFNGWKNMKIEHFEDIEAWSRLFTRSGARELKRKVYRLTKKQSFEKETTVEP